ncbi:MAG: response regulator [Peptococcia bacterium]|jgi:two-component system response regulator (stage 0 sporulation protein F)
MNMKRTQVLIVDDQEGVRELLLETCFLLGYEAMAVNSGLEALDLVQKHDFQIVLVDMKMPGLNGLRTTERLLATEKNLNIIVMSGFCECESEIEEIYSHLNVAAVMKKPFNLEELKSILDKIS